MVYPPANENVVAAPVQQPVNAIQTCKVNICRTEDLTTKAFRIPQQTGRNVNSGPKL